MINSAPRNKIYKQHSTQFVNSNQVKNTQFVDKNYVSGFGGRLREVFKEATNTEIAEIIGVKKSAITNYVNDRVPDSERLLRIAEYTGCSLHWLLTGEGPKYLSDIQFRPDDKSPQYITSDDKQNFQNEIDKLNKRLTTLEAAVFRFTQEEKNKTVRKNQQNELKGISGSPSAGDKKRLPTYEEIEEEFGVPMDVTARIRARMDLRGITIREMWIVYEAFDMNTSNLPTEYNDEELFIKDDSALKEESPNKSVSKKSNGH